MKTLTPEQKAINKFQNFTDEELVAKVAKTKNDLLFMVLYQRYESSVYNKCLYFLKDEADALATSKQVLADAFSKLNTFKHHRFNDWLCALTYETCVKHLNKRRKKQSLNYIDNIVVDNHIHIEVSDAMLFKMRAGKLSKAIEMVDPEDKAILLLRYQDGVDEKDLLLLLNIDETALKAKLRKAKARIIEMYNEL